MPIVAPMPCSFPESLFGDNDSPSERPGQWLVAYTKANMEKTLARHLRARQVTHYLPMELNTRKKNGRTFTSQMPIFPGYLFLFGDSEDRITALESNVISRVLDVADQDRLSRDLRRVDRLICSDLPLEVTAMAPGQAVEIVAGPLTGLQGTLVRYGSQMRLVVEVNFLRQAVTAEVEPWMVEPIYKSMIATVA